MADTNIAAPDSTSTDSLTNLQADGDGSVSLPEGRSLADAMFEMNDGDLLVTWPDGATAGVENFAATTPDLMDSDGAQMSGDMAVQLAEIDSPSDDTVAISFETGDDNVVGGTDGAPIGSVEDADGSVFATRVDGTRVELEIGDPVFQGDIIESGADGSIGIVLADNTTFSMGEDGSMVLDEMIYDPDTQDGSVSLSVLEGVFTFVSGQVAKTDPDAMTIDTPVATIGIRGTQVGINVREGEDMDVILMEEADGFVGEVVVQNDGGVVILNTAFAGTNVGSYDAAPTDGYDVNRADFLQDFGSSLKALPGVHNANTYGVNEQNLDILIEEAIQAQEQLDEQGEDNLTLEDALTGEESEAEAEAAARIEEELIEEQRLEEEERLAEEQLLEEEKALEEEQRLAEEQLLEEERLLEEENLRNVELALEEEEREAAELLAFALEEERNETALASEIVFGEEDDRTDEISTAETEVTVDPAEQARQNVSSQINTGGSNDVSVTTDSSGGYSIVGGADSTLSADLSGFSENFSVDLSASSGDNSVQLGTGSDTVTTGSGADFIYSGDGDDTVIAGAGDDVIQGGTGGGDDKYVGGEGADWVLYPSAVEGYDLIVNLDETASYTHTLANGETLTIDPERATDITTSVGEETWIDSDILEGIENVLAGDGDDVVIGSDEANTLVGNLGDDVLLGGGGNDTLIGGSTYNNNDSSVSGTGYLGDGSAILGADGNDYLDGGAGTDTAVFGGTFGGYRQRQ